MIDKRSSWDFLARWPFVTESGTVFAALVAVVAAAITAGSLASVHA